MKQVRLSVMAVLATAFLAAAPAQAWFEKGASVGPGGRAMGMGGAFVAVADDSSAVFWNPAGAGQLRQGELSVSYFSMFHGDITQMSPSLVLPAGPNLALGLAMNRRSFDIEWYDMWGNRVTSDAMNEDTYIFSLAGALNDERSLFAGASLKFFSMEWPYTGMGDFDVSGQGIDAGLLYLLRMGESGEDLRFGLAMLDINSRISEKGATSWDLPSIFSLGVAYRPREELTLSMARDTQDDPSISGGSTSLMRFGVEVNVLRDVLAVRMGYIDMETVEGRFTMGAGVKAGGLVGEYAYLEDTGNLGSSHRFSVGFRFGPLPAVLPYGEFNWDDPGEFQIPGKSPDPKRWILYEIEPDYYYRDLMERNAGDEGEPKGSGVTR